jgi:hypothetical protein
VAEEQSDREAQLERLRREAAELLEIGNRAVKRAHEENRRRGIPNAYLHNGIINYELPNGEFTLEDPFKNDAAKMNGGS